MLPAGARTGTTARSTLTTMQVNRFIMFQSLIPFCHPESLVAEMKEVVSLLNDQYIFMYSIRRFPKHTVTVQFLCATCQNKEDQQKQKEYSFHLYIFSISFP